MNKNLESAPVLVTAFVLLSMAFCFVLPAKLLSESVPGTELAPATESVTSTRAETSFGNIPVYFEENAGQFDKRVKYFARGTRGYSLFLTGTAAVYVLQQVKMEKEDSVIDPDKNGRLRADERTPPENRKAAAVFMRLAGANQTSNFAGLEQMEHKTNYFKGRESNWRTGIPNFRQVRVNDVYEGIDAVWKGGESGSVQYDFIVEPYADPGKIEWKITGAESVSIDERGDLLINTEFGTIRQQKPYSFQEGSNGFRQEVESGFRLKEPSEGAAGQAPKSFDVSFDVGGYDRSKTLTIDPSVNLSNLSFSTFLGGSGDDAANGIAVDRVGNVYTTGRTLSTEFPVTPGTFDTGHNGGTDVFVTKLNASGSAIVYSTFIGGDGGDSGNGIAVDAAGNVYITGQAGEGFLMNYPTTSGAFDTTPNGLEDVFVTKLSPKGSALVYSTLVGGGSSDRGLSIAVDPLGKAVITGWSFQDATVYPTTAGAFDTSYNGNEDVVVTKLNAAGSALDYSTFIGGDQSDIGNDIAIDASGNAFVIGTTPNSAGIVYPTTAGAYDTTHNGGFDVFVTKLNAAGSALVYSTLIGGSALDFGVGIALDASGNAFIDGYCSANFPVTAGAFDTTPNGGDDVFVTKLNAAGTALVYSTLIGGSGNDSGLGIAVNGTGNAFVSGYTQDAATDYPTTPGAFNTTHNGGFDVFVTKLNAAGTALAYSTLIGGSAGDFGGPIAVDESGNAFFAGSTNDGVTDYPTTAEAFSSDLNGGSDVFVSKLGDFSISGRTLDTAGLPLPNTSVAMSGDNSGFLLSDSDGYFLFGDTVMGGSNLISATQILHNFNPPNYQVTVNRNKQLTFVGRPISSGPTAAFADLGGKVRSTVGNVALANTRLTLIDTVNGGVETAMSDANGDYEFNQVTGRFYLVIPEREGYTFSPPIYNVNHFHEDLNLDFAATPGSPRPVNDFDGDGKSDLAVFRPAEGNWYILQSQSNLVRTVRFGLDGDIPVAEDYDGDDRPDIAVYRPAEGSWYILNSSDARFSAITFGSGGDQPIPADFDGDGKTDIAVFRPSTGVWHRLESSDGRYKAVQFGVSTDKPVPADFDRDGKADLAVFRDGVWYRLRSSDGQVQTDQFGIADDIPLPMDFSGDGSPDLAVFRPSTGVWYWLGSSNGDFQARQFGNSTDIPTPADYNGDGRYEQAVFRNGTWYVLRNDASFYSAQFGQTDDVPVN